MIYGIFHEGSGVGNQLFRYIATRTLAEQKGVKYSFINPEGFKAGEFIKMNFGEYTAIPWTLGEGGKVIPEGERKLWEEKKVNENGVDIRGYDPEINFIHDNTIIDGEFQDDKY